MKLCTIMRILDLLLNERGFLGSPSSLKTVGRRDRANWHLTHVDSIKTSSKAPARAGARSMGSIALPILAATPKTLADFQNPPARTTGH
jgi:hypothetical protein